VLNTKTTLYRFYDAEDTLLYVGITSGGPRRWREHEAFPSWWAQVARSTVEHFPDRESAAAAEWAAVLAEGPSHNVRLMGVHVSRPAPAGYRRHGSGTIVRMAKGRWGVSLGARGTRKQWTFGTELDARLVLAAVEYRGASDRAKAIAIDVLNAGADWPTSGD
jgi:hypothetical protein